MKIVFCQLGYVCWISKKKQFLNNLQYKQFYYEFAQEAVT